MPNQIEQLTLGGQAVIEGVLIKSKKHYAIAVRTPTKNIKVKVERYLSLIERYPILQLPFLRGVIVLFEMLVIGMKALTYSANEALEEDEQLSSWGLALTILFSLAAGIGLFVILPYVLTYVLGLTEQSRPFIFNIVDGGIKLALFLVYLLAIAQMKDIKRLFQYHGAEHKAVHCYEAKKPLTIKNVQSFDTVHPRCGTSFILLVLVSGIVLFSFVPYLVQLVVHLEAFHWLIQKIILLGVRIVSMVPIAGIAYEILKIGGKYPHSILMKPLLWPGLLVQRITTQPPDNKQVAVAIKAVEALIQKKKNS